MKKMHLQTEDVAETGIAMERQQWEELTVDWDMWGEEEKVPEA